MALPDEPPHDLVDAPSDSDDEELIMDALFQDGDAEATSDDDAAMVDDEDGEDAARLLAAGMRAALALPESERAERGLPAHLAACAIVAQMREALQLLSPDESAVASRVLRAMGSAFRLPARAHVCAGPRWPRRQPALLC